MPKAANISGITVKLPPNMANGGWDIDADILHDFASAHGITIPIHIRFTTGHSNYGTHVVRTRNGRHFHSITLEQNQSESSARITFLHELCHAIQVEREMIESPDISAQDADIRFVIKYRRNKWVYENEAESFAYDSEEKWFGIIY